MEQMTPAHVAERFSEGWAPFILDVRNETEAAISTLPRTDLLCPYDQLESVLDQLPRQGDLLIYCRSGGRSAIACAWLDARGFEATINLDGGINEWARQVDPSLPVY